MSILVPPIGWKVSGGRKPFIPTYIGNNTSSATGSSFDAGNFTAPSVGWLLVGVVNTTNNTSRYVTSVSIGGAAGTILVQNPTSSGGVSRATAIAHRAVGAGAQNVTVNLDATGGAGAVWAVAVFWVDSEPEIITSQTLSGTGTPVGISLDFEDDTFAMYCAAHGSSNTTFTWSGATLRVFNSSNFNAGVIASKQRASAATGNVESWGHSSVDYQLSAVSLRAK